MSEESWTDAQQALKEVAKQHAAMLSKERDAKMDAVRRAKGAEKALRALPAAFERAIVAEEAVAKATGKPPPPKSSSGRMSDEAAAAAASKAAAEAVERVEADAQQKEELLRAEMAELEERRAELELQRVDAEAARDAAAKELEAERAARQLEAEAAQAQSATAGDELSAVRCELEELRTALVTEQMEGASAVRDVDALRAQAAAAEARAAESEAGNARVVEREEAMRNLLARQIRMHTRTLNSMADHLSPSVASSS